MIQATVTTAPYLVTRRTVNDDYDLIARKTQMDNILLIPGLDRPNPNNLFRDGQVGGWLDPYDLTKMWVDNAGTTPMTASDLGVGIGRIQSKGGPVITFEQATSGDRPVWGRHPVSGIRNLLTFSEQFDNAAWPKTAVTVTANTTETLDPFGQNFADKLVETVDNSVHSLRQSVAISTGSTITMSVYAKAAERGFIRFWEDVQTGHQAFFNLGTGVATNVNMSSVSMTDAGNGWWRCSGTVVSATGASRGMRILVTTDGGNTAYAGTAGSGVYIYGAQVVEGTTATPYQKVTNRFDITETGQPDLYYFSGNGVNQRWRSAANLDLSGVNELTVWAGVRTNQGSTRAAIYSHNTDAVNFSQLEAPGFTSNNYEFSVRTGLTCPIADSPYTAPTTDALVGVHNRDARQLWRNGSLVDTGTGDSGANNLPNAPLDIFYRGSGPDRFFNGNMYSFIIAGDNYDTRTIQQFSDWLLKPRRLITA